MGPAKSRTGNRKVDMILSKSQEKYKHHGNEFVELFQIIFLKLCYEDGLINRGFTQSQIDKYKEVA